MSESTESAIFRSIPGFGDDDTAQDTISNDTTNPNTGTGEGDGSTQTTSANPTTGTEGVDQSRSGSGATDSNGQPNGQQTQQTQQEIRRRHDGLIERQNPDNPNTRDLVDPRTGQTVARGGVERRIFEQGQLHQRENVALRQQLQRAEEFVRGVGEVTQTGHRLNLDARTQVIALETMADFIRDPVKTLELLVAEVKSRGLPIPFLEQGVSPGIDMNAIQRMIDNKMAPITQQTQQRQQQEQQQQRDRAQVDAFFRDFPDAEVNVDIIAGMMRNEPGLSMNRAYGLMVQWAHQNGLDYTQPLKPQIDARNQQNSQPNNQPPTQRNERPLPGATRTASTSGARPMNEARQFDENSSWRDIISDSMRG